MNPAPSCVSASFGDLMAVADGSFPWFFVLAIAGGFIGALSVELLLTVVDRFRHE